MKILVSACLLGKKCRYDGKGKPHAAVISFGKEHQLIPICPEVLGGLPTPRLPSECCGERVFDSSGRDVTDFFKRGAERVLQLAEQHACRNAILKEKSPSCGKGMVYDGSFTQTLCAGNGITAALLMKNGIRVFGESELLQLIKTITAEKM